MTPETSVKHSVKQALDLLGVFHFPILQGLGAARGIPDRIAVIDGRFIAIEIKRPGGKLSEHQETFKHRVEKAGGVFLTISDVEDLVNYVRTKSYEQGSKTPTN